MTGGAVGGKGSASENQLLSKWIADDDGIVVTAVDSYISIGQHINSMFA